jgi:hypothetical protein
MRRTKFKIKSSLETRTGKYFMARSSGKTKKDSALEAGYPMSTALHSAAKIEENQEFKYLQNHYKDSLLDKISLDELAEEHIKTIRQDRDLGAKNTALKMALDKIEPNATPSEDDNKVLVILSK